MYLLIYNSNGDSILISALILLICSLFFVNLISDSPSTTPFPKLYIDSGGKPRTSLLKSSRLF